MMALFFFIAHENGFKFHAQPQTDAYSCYFISRRCTVPCEVLGLLRLPDNCAPYVIIYTGAQLSGSGAQLSGPGAQLSGPGAQLSAILVCIPTYVISAPLCMYRSLEAPSKTSDTIFWVAVMCWSAAFLFRELKKVDISSIRLSGAWFTPILLYVPWQS